MLVPVFSLQLNNKVHPRTLAVGKFNGKRSSLVGATAGNKVELNLICNRMFRGLIFPRFLFIHQIILIFNQNN